MLLVLISYYPVLNIVHLLNYKYRVGGIIIRR